MLSYDKDGKFIGEGKNRFIEGSETSFANHLNILISFTTQIHSDFGTWIKYKGGTLYQLPRGSLPEDTRRDT